MQRLPGSRLDAESLVPTSFVPGETKLVFLRWRKNAKSVDGQLWELVRLPENPFQIAQETEDGGAVEEIGAILETQAQTAVGQLPSKEGEIELRRPSVDFDLPSLQTRQTQGRQRCVLQGSQHPEERGLSELALRIDGFHHLLEGQLLVVQGSPHHRVETS